MLNKFRGINFLFLFKFIGIELVVDIGLIKDGLLVWMVSDVSVQFSKPINWFCVDVFSVVSEFSLSHFSFSFSMLLL